MESNQTTLKVLSSSSSSYSKRMRKPEHIEDPLKWVILPDNKFFKGWNAVMLLLIFVTCFTTPFEIGIMSGYAKSISENPGLTALGMLMNGFFVVDTVFNFFKAYKKVDGRYVYSLKKIRRHYSRGYFFVDVLSCFPSDIIILASANQALRPLKVFELFRLFRISRAKRILNSSSSFVDFKLRTPVHLRLLTYYLFILIIVNHYLACFWALVAFLETKSFNETAMEETPNWILKYISTAETQLMPFGYESQNIWDRYILSLYWAIMTVTSIGYGDVLPDTPIEYWICTFCMLLGGILWAYIIGATVSIADALNEDRDTFEGKLKNLNIVIRETPELQSDKDAATKLRQYVFTKFQRGCTAAEVRNNVLEDLSPGLQELVKRATFKPFIHSINALSSTLSNAAEETYILNKLAGNVVLEHYSQGEYRTIDDKQDKDELSYRGIRIIREGLLYVNLHGSAVILRRFGNFGSDSVFLSENSSLLVPRRLFALIYSEVYMFPRDTLMEVSEEYSDIWKYARWKVAGLQVRKWAASVHSKSSRGDETEAILDEKINIKILTAES